MKNYFSTCTKVFRADPAHFGTVTGLAGGLYDIWRGHTACVAINLIESSGDMFAEPTPEQIELAWLERLSEPEKRLIESWM